MFNSLESQSKFGCYTIETVEAEIQKQNESKVVYDTGCYYLLCCNGNHVEGNALSEHIFWGTSIHVLLFL